MSLLPIFEPERHRQEKKSSNAVTKLTIPRMNINLMANTESNMFISASLASSPAYSTITFAVIEG